MGTAVHPNRERYLQATVNHFPSFATKTLPLGKTTVANEGQCFVHSVTSPISSSIFMDDDMKVKWRSRVKGVKRVDHFSGESCSCCRRQ